jgi:hypothetical protein
METTVASTIAVILCFLCGKDVPPGHRCVLKKLDEDPILSLKELLEEKYSSGTVHHLLHHQQNIVVCKGRCHNTLKKLVKLKKDLAEIKTEITSKLDHHQLGEESLNQSNSELTSPPYELRTQLDTPTRRVIAQSYSTDSPVVSVSHNCFLYLCIK